MTHSFGRTVKLAEHSRLAAIGGFASGIAHEIRSPLSTIGMALEYLQKSELPPAAEKRAALAHQETRRLARLLEEMLLYAKPLKLELKTFDLGAFLQQFLQSQMTLVKLRNQSHECEIATDNSVILGDTDRLQQVFLNLANNACEASPDGSAIRWKLSKDSPDQVLILRILNPGDAISEQNLARVFEPFFTTKSNGTGLGLGIVKRIINAHGGEIRIISAAGAGTEVLLQIPRACTTSVRSTLTVENQRSRLTAASPPHSVRLD